MTLVLVQEGDGPCRTCGKPHNAYRAENETYWGSWRDPDDGHPYRPMSNKELCERFTLTPK